ncbi:N-acetylmuramoyl-L-alanine amidase [Flaviflexus huanghaiensis]|uniref:N-acetylmuramoyl-L-alanine amidase n=1 Tax=Flaviflexus huanghaiensis TaxID=1111473 RepID=UPI0015FB47B9|nr:N-acetylmuramoyl-L-alanine amidase [Flaviflexus huanghaiensis]
MRVRVAVLGSALILAPTAAIAEPIHGTAVIDLLEAGDTTQPASMTSDAAAGYELLTEPLAADEFFVAGVTWEGTAPHSVEIRALEQGEWGDWYSLEIESDLEGRDGTEPYIAGGAHGIQVRVAGDVIPAALHLALSSGSGGASPSQEIPDGAAVPPAPGTEADEAINADEQVSEPLLDAYTGTNSSATIGQPAEAIPASLMLPMSPSAASVPAPRVVSRAQWGETRVPPIWRPSYATLGGAVIHHTAGSNNYSAAQAPSVVKSVHDYHTYSWGRGWDDIGYNFLIDRFGTIYEGRYGSLASAPGKMVVGGHAVPANTGSVGISVMGTYTGSIQPSVSSMRAIEDIIAWQFSTGNVDPRGTWTFYNSRLGRYSTVPAILGHRDVASTACPGNIYPLIPSVRANVAAKIESARKPQRGDNDLVIYKTNDFSPTANDYQYFGKSGDELYVGNPLGNGDLPFIRRGNTFIFAERPTSPTTTRTHVLGHAGQDVFTGDIDGTGKEAVILRTGNRFDIYQNPAINRPTKTIHYGRAGDEVFVFDWDGDGMDEITVRRGNRFYLKWTVTSGNADREINYGRPGDEVYVGRWSSAKSETITVRRGIRYYMSYSNVSGVADKEFDYGRIGDRVVVGDWDRDGRDGLGVVRDLTK